mmetsp:Transcript_74739/g.177822  ORF Transcript_74739/g.177822 Transcript_74739/m.177822 type:complete len:269 (-) Transcript_74739:30-836(-)
MGHSIGCNDCVLFLSLVYSSIDLQVEWDAFCECRRPIHVWLLVSYLAVIAFRTMHILGVEVAPTGASSHFLLDMRQKGALPRMLASFTWTLALPFFTIWTSVGTYWYVEVQRDTPDCMPSGSHTWFTILWLALSYMWITFHVFLAIMALVLELRVRRAEGDLRQVEDADTVSRWGQVSQVAGHWSLPSASDQQKALSPAQIASLPSTTLPLVTEDCSQELECSICLVQMCGGECVRELPGCGHCFHRACIDLWLLRRADCPLCKADVM